MTRESYYHLIKSGPTVKDIKGYELSYKEMDSETDYDNIFRELRIESLMKKPQYNIVRWNNNIRTERDAMHFLKKNNIKYLISRKPFKIGDEKIEDTKIASLIKVFRPRNKRIYQIEYTDTNLFLYKVE